MQGINILFLSTTFFICILSSVSKEIQANVVACLLVGINYSELSKWLQILRRWWQTYLVILVVYSAWASPFELAFRKAATGSRSLMPIDLVVDGFFAFDIILTFFVAYLDKSTYLLVDDPKKIARRWILNLLVCFVNCEVKWYISCIFFHSFFQVPHQAVVSIGCGFNPTICTHIQTFHWTNEWWWGFRIS